MKTFNNYFLILICLFVISCEKDTTENVSRVTFFPEFTYSGSELLLLPCNSSFTDPGVTATEGGKALEVKTVFSEGLYFGTTANTSSLQPDKYVINYSATNVDGFSGQRERTIFVACTGDMVTSLEGLYTSTVVRNGVVSAQYTDLKYVIIKKTGANTYAISDAIGGYYDYGRAYGDAYAAKGIVITANNIAANDFSFNGPVGVGAFGGNLTMGTMTVNSANKTINFSAAWDAGFNFVVTLKQVNL